MTMQYTLTPNAITIIDEQKNVHTLNIGDKFNQVLGLIKAGKIGKVLQLLSPKACIETKLKGIKIISDEVIQYNGKMYSEKEYVGLIEYIVECSQSKKPYEYLLKFLDNLSLNPDANSRLNLFKFLNHCGILITENGYIAGVKSVNMDWTSHHDNKTLHKIGTFVSYPREQCDSNPDSACSRGLHTGSIEYVKGMYNNGHKIITITNPRDVVCVPVCSSFQKMRACLYYIAEEIQETSWEKWEIELKKSNVNKILIDFDNQKVINEKKEEKAVAKSVEKQVKKAEKVKEKTGKVTSKSFVLKTISRNRLSLPSNIVRLIHAKAGDELSLAAKPTALYLYKKLPKNIEEECVYKVDRDNMVSISEVRLNEIGGGMFFVVTIENDAIVIQKSKGKK